MSTEQITTSTDIQNAYLKFYPFMMQYLWDINTVINLANLEISIYKRFPNKEEMEKYIDLLEKAIKDTYKDEELLNNKDFKKAFEHLKSYIQDYDNTGFEIYNMVPNLDVAKILGKDNPEDESEGEKKTIQVGKIVRR